MPAISICSTTGSADMHANPRKTTSVRNDGETDRIQLIFEYYDADQPSWLAS